MLSRRRLVFGYVSGVFLIGVILFGYYSTKESNGLLKKDGIVIKGVVSEVYLRKRGYHYKYSFEIGSLVYYNWGRSYKKIYIGDTIDVVYYKKDPAINKSL